MTPHRVDVDRLIRALGYDPNWIPADTKAYWSARSATPEAVIAALGLTKITPPCRVCAERES